jgi:hypothetical protein
MIEERGTGLPDLRKDFNPSKKFWMVNANVMPSLTRSECALAPK